jgi:hypothetical protein
MTIKLNRRAYEHAQSFIKERKVMLDERDAWNEHQPSAQEENRFIEERGLNDYAK